MNTTTNNFYSVTWDNSLSADWCYKTDNMIVKWIINEDDRSFEAAELEELYNLRKD